MDTTLTVILLSGGGSTRFWPLAEKTTIPFFGKAFLSMHFEQLVGIGIKKCIVVTNTETDAHIRAITPPQDLSVTYVIQEGDGMVQAILALEGSIDGPMLILNASDWYADSFLKTFMHDIQGKATPVIGAVKVPSYFPGGYLRFNTDKTVAEIVEKPKEGTEPSDVVTIVADYFPEAQVFIKAAKDFGQDAASGFEKAINMLISDGLSCSAEVVSDTDWSPMKYPWNVLSIMERIGESYTEQRIHPSVEIKKNVIIEGPVVIEDGVKIFEGSKIVGPCFIGKHTIIGNNNIIRSSIIGEDCVTGFNTDITRSYIGNDCWFHSNYIGDSVLGNDISLGSGAVLANLRLDDGEISTIVKEQKVQTGRNKLGALIGSHVRIGVNVSIMPGVKIGAGSFIMSGIVVSKDIPEGSFVTYTPADMVIKPNTTHAADSRSEFRKKI